MTKLQNSKPYKLKIFFLCVRKSSSNTLTSTKHQTNKIQNSNLSNKLSNGRQSPALSSSTMRERLPNRTIHTGGVSAKQKERLKELQNQSLRPRKPRQISLSENSDGMKTALERKNAFDANSNKSDPESTLVENGESSNTIICNSGGYSGSVILKKKSGKSRGVGSDNDSNIIKDSESLIPSISLKMSKKETLKSKFTKRRPKIVMVDRASQTDFPWTEEDEKREKRRRKRERAEMRKQMYLLKSSPSKDTISSKTNSPSKNTTIQEVATQESINDENTKLIYSNKRQKSFTVVSGNENKIKSPAKYGNSFHVSSNKKKSLKGRQKGHENLINPINFGVNFGEQNLVLTRKNSQSYSKQHQKEPETFDKTIFLRHRSMTDNTGMNSDARKQHLKLKTKAKKALQDSSIASLRPNMLADSVRVKSKDDIIGHNLTVKRNMTKSYHGYQSNDNHTRYYYNSTRRDRSSDRHRKPS